MSPPNAAATVRGQIAQRGLRLARDVQKRPVDLRTPQRQLQRARAAEGEPADGQVGGVDLQVRADPARHVVGHVGLGRPQPGVHAQRVAQARPGDVGHDHHRRETVVRGGEPVHHRRQPPGQQPVLQDRPAGQGSAPAPAAAPAPSPDKRAADTATRAGPGTVNACPGSSPWRSARCGAYPAARARSGPTAAGAGGPHRRPHGSCARSTWLAAGSPSAAPIVGRYP